MIYLLTATGARPEGLRLLAGFFNAQTYRQPMRWLICDDCDPATPTPAVREGIEVEVIRPPWRWTPNGGSTQAASMAALLERVPADAIAVCAEDDDCYLPDHVANVVGALDHHELVGERVSRYYNVATRRHRELPGTYHASMASTALRGAAIDRLRAVCMTGKHLDMDLWRTFDGPKRLLDTNNVVGIKGLPGRGGIGIGHRDTFGDPDPCGDVLRSWIGAERSGEYAWFRRK